MKSPLHNQAHIFGNKETEDHDTSSALKLQESSRREENKSEIREKLLLLCGKDSRMKKFVTN